MNKSYKILKLNITVSSFTGFDRWKSKLARFDDQTGNWRALCCGLGADWLVPWSGGSLLPSQRVSPSNVNA